MKKLIIASVLAAAAFGAQASETTVKICDTAVTSFFGADVVKYQKSSVVISDSGDQFAVFLPKSGDTLVSPELETRAENGALGTVDGVTFMRLDGGKGYSAGMAEQDLRLNFVNCKAGVKS